MKLAMLLRHRSDRRGMPHVSLFPFLAVLICTMGALVIVLLVVMRQARLQAVREAAAKAVQRQATLRAARQADHAKIRTRIEALESQQRETQSQRAEVHANLANLESQSDQLRKRLEQLRSAAQDLEQKTAQGDRQRGEAAGELESAEAKVTEAERRLAAARNTAQQRTPSYAIMPYEGRHETRRRPIYVECRAEAVVLQPEGIAFDEGDFAGGPGAENPLAAAIRAASDYLLAHPGSEAGQDGKPYPLLLVRPGGIAAYYVARAAINSLGSEFGYELVDQSWRLQFPPSNPALARAVGDAVAAARVRQEQMLANAPSRANRRSKPVYQVSPVGVVKRVGGSPSDDEDSAAAGPQTASGRLGGPGGNGPGRSAGSGGGGVGGGFGGSAGLATAAFGRGPGGPGGNGSGTGGPGGYGGGEGGSGGYGGGTTGRTGSFGGGSTAGGGAEGLGSGSSGGGVASGTTGDSGGFAPAVGGLGPRTGGSGGYGSGGAASNQGLAGTAGTAGPGGPRAGQSLEGQGFRGESSGGATASAASGAVPPEDGQPRATPSRRAMARPEGYIEGRHADPQQQAEASRPRTSAGGQVAMPLRPGEWYPTEVRPKVEEEREEKQAQRKKAKPLAEERGRNWGLRDVTRSAAAISRPIYVLGYTDRLVLLAESGAQEKVIPVGPRTESAIDPLMTAIWKHMDGWGIAGKGMYWRPMLSITVAPGAEQRFTELSTLLQGSGLVVERSR